MLNVKETGLLLAIIKHCNSIIRISSGVTREKFDEDEDLRDLLCFHVLQIGELVNHFDEDFILLHPGIPWKKIIGMRNKVAHGYDYIDNETVWGTISTDIDTLLKYCEAIKSDN